MELWFWILGGILCAITVVGNGGVIVLITTRRRLRTTANCFVLSLAVADFSFGAAFLPLEKMFNDNANRIICLLAPITLGTASITNLCVMTLDRYIAIVHPLRYVTFMRPRRVGLLISAAWVMALTRPLLYLKEMRVVTNSTGDALSRLDSVLYQVIPCIALLLATIHILLIVRQHSKQTAALEAQLRHSYPFRSPQERTESRRQTASNKTQEAISARVLLAVVGVFILCFGMKTFTDFSRENSVLYDLFLILLIINSAVNPLRTRFSRQTSKEKCRSAYAASKTTRHLQSEASRNRM